MKVQNVNYCPEIFSLFFPEQQKLWEKISSQTSLLIPILDIDMMLQ